MSNENQEKQNLVAKDSKEKKEIRKMLINYIMRKISGENVDAGGLAVSLISIGVNAKEDAKTDDNIVIPEGSYHVVGKEPLEGAVYQVPKVESFWEDTENGFNADLEDIALAVASEHLVLGAGKDMVQVFDNRDLAVEYYSEEILKYLKEAPDDPIAQGVATILQIMN